MFTHSAIDCATVPGLRIGETFVQLLLTPRTINGDTNGDRCIMASASAFAAFAATAFSSSANGGTAFALQLRCVHWRSGADV